MLLTGAFPRSLDEKHRFSIPKCLRGVLERNGAAVLYIAPGTDGSLALYPEAVFRRLADQLGDGSPTAHEIRAFSRLFYAQAQRVELDRQGRVRVPQQLAELAGLQGDIVLLGVRDHLEVWGRTRWEAYLAQTQPCYDQIAERAFGAVGQAAAPAMKAGASEPVDGPPRRPR